MRERHQPRVCQGPSRRALLRAGVLSAFGLGLRDLLHGRTLARGESDSSGFQPGTAKSCILVWMAGGPSHIDTFDPKPDASSDVRGEFKPIATNVPGVSISEVFPRLAQSMNKLALIRSLTSPEAEHDRASQHLLTGYRPSPAMQYPSYGSVVGKVRGFSASTLPPYVAVPDAPFAASSGYLTPAFDPFAVGGDPNQGNFRVRDLTPPDRLTLERLQRRKRMVRSLDGFARDVPDTPLTTSRDSFSEQAYELLTSSQAQAAFQIDSESAATRERYGRTPCGQACLLARRLIEAGVGFVSVNDRGMGQAAWDTHVQNFPMIKDTLAPPLDQGLSTLIHDLDERGMLESTLVVVMGEFGRTPKINPNAGRDHHGRANSVLMAGGGITPGVVLGKTDERGDSPVDRPVTPADLAATLFTALGIDPDRTFETPDGQPIRLVDKGKSIKEIMS